MRLLGHGIGVDLPRGWEGVIYRRPDGDPTLHAANFALPADDGDFGSLAVSSMASDGAFIALTEYDSALAGQGLFAAAGLRLPLRESETDPMAMMRPVRGRAGVQRFFTASGRAFCLYVVVGTRPTRERLIGDVNMVLSTVSISPHGPSSGPLT